MEKISRIIPPSTRQVWVSGEIPKPRRIAEPTEDYVGIPQSSQFEKPAPNGETVSRDVSGFRGTKIDTTA